jgi:O-antigen/teichoic acid export membrane protein
MLPLFHGYLSKQDFGLWNAALAVGGMVLLFDLGVKSDLLTRLSENLWNKDYSQAQVDISNALAVVFAVAPFGVLALVLISLNLQPPSISSLMIYIAVILGTLVTLIGQFATTVFLAQGNTIGNSLTQISGVLCAATTCYVLVVLNADFWILAFAYSATGGFVFIFAFGYFLLHRHWLRPVRRLVNLNTAKRIVANSFDYFKLTALTVVAYNSDILLVTSKFGLASGEIFSIPSRISSLFALVIMGINMPLWAILAAQNRNTKKAQMRMLIFNCALGVVAVVLAGTIISIYANEVVFLWVGAHIPQQQAIMSAITVQNVVIAAFTPFMIGLNAKSQLKYLVWGWATYITASVPLKLFLVTSDQLVLLPVISLTVYFLTLLPAICFSIRLFKNDHGTQN